MKKLIAISVLSITLILAGCASSQSKGQSNSTQSASATSGTSSSSTVDSNSKVFTLDQLKKYNGQNGNPAYVAVNGVVYDVTNAQGWRNGMHQGGASAGNDLTNLIKQSPHGKSVLKGLPVVGKLQ